MIVFQNPGEIDIRAVTMLGVNVKSEASAIGYFGTGLKYAIAVLLREGQKVEVWSGTKRYAFGTQLETIRGKDFRRIVMSGPEGKVELALTLEFGKNWKLEDAYRELWSNCMDEKGSVNEDRTSTINQFYPDGIPDLEENREIPLEQQTLRRGTPGYTMICITGSAFSEVHDERFGKVLLPQNLKLIAKNASLEVFSGQSNFIYYKGIRVYESKKPFLNTYNLIDNNIGLTEDRTLVGGTYYLDDRLYRFLVCDAEEKLIESILCCGEQYHEAMNLSFQYCTTPSEPFLKATEKGWKQNPMMLNSSAKELMFRKKGEKGKEVEYPAATLNSTEQTDLAVAIAELASWGYHLDSYELTITEDAGNLIMGLAIHPNKIILARKILSDGDKLRGTLIEEIVHLRFGVGDESRAMQEVLINELVRLGYILTQVRALVPSNSSVLPATDDEIPF